MFIVKHIIAFILFKLNLKIYKLSFHKKYELIAPIIEKLNLLKAHHLLKKYKYKKYFVINNKLRIHKNETNANIIFK